MKNSYTNYNSNSYKNQDLMMDSNRSGGQKYIKWIVLAVVGAILGAGFFAYTQHQKHKKIEIASGLYEGVLKSMSQNNFKKAAEDAEMLVKQSPEPYSSLGAMVLARIAIDKNDVPTAISHLTFAMKVGKNGPIEHIARVRLARILLGDEQYDEALKVLNDSNEPQDFVALYEETKGDIYLKKNDPLKAKTSYDAALKATPPGIPTHALQMKYNDVQNEAVQKVINKDERKEKEKS